MTPRAARDEQYRQEKNRTTSEILENIYLAPFMKYIDPTTPIRFLEEIGSRKPRFREAFYESGLDCSLERTSRSFGAPWRLREPFHR